MVLDNPANEPTPGCSNAIAVIELPDSDDEEHLLLKRKKISSKCINYECRSGVGLKICPSFCLSYFRVKTKDEKPQEVCDECYEEAFQHFQKLATTLIDGGLLIEQDCPSRNDLVEVLDSDDEDESMQDEKEEPEYFNEEDHMFIAENLGTIMNDTLVQYDFGRQISGSKGVINNSIDTLQTAFGEIEKCLGESQKVLDNIRTKLYAEYRVEMKELPPIEIIDISPTPNPLYPVLLPRFSPLKPKPAILPKSPVMVRIEPRPPSTLSIPVTPPKQPERRSHRNITKPASYAEFLDLDTVEDEAEQVPKVVEVAVNNEPDVEVLSVIKAPELPPKGVFVRTQPVVGDQCYSMKQSPFGAWVKVRIIDIVIINGITNYKTRYDGKKLATIRVVSGKQLAYTVPSPVQLEVGTRVIAVFVEDANPYADNYFMGLVAEPLCAANSFRYLIFFDDGYAQYVTHEKVLVVCECSKNVWEDIHPDSRLFIKKYLESYPERPMVKLHPGHIVKTEWNGKWWVARVIKVEGSLAQMYFDADARSEWIYRGSTRLGPLFLEMQAATNRQEKGPHTPKLIKKDQPYVEYTRLGLGLAPGISSRPETATGDLKEEINEINDDAGPSTAAQGPVVHRAVARKSTTSRPMNLPSSTINISPPGVVPSNTVPFLPTQQVQQPQSKVVYFTPKTVVAPRRYVPHACSSDCKRYVPIPVHQLKGYNPLSKPLLCGWYRVIHKHRGKKCVRYHAPCAKSIRNLPELHRYLRITRSELSVDMFDFDNWVHCLAEFVLDRSFRTKRDMSNGVENVIIPCVNYVDETLPDFCNYSTKREPTEGVSLNLDPEFLCGCDCMDDCANKEKCQCWQLTVREFRTVNKRTPVDLIGYTYKRLPEFVTTGIYECNQRCKCSATCLNRVVQHPLQLKLQLFKTANRGWGIRCLNDIPQGAFICIYAGSLLTDKMANEGGVNYGDEYLAELDYIEVVERQKDGYESDVEDMDLDDYSQEDELFGMRSAYEKENDRPFVCHVGNGSSGLDSPIRTRLRTRTTDSDTDAKPPENQPEEIKKAPDTLTIDESETVMISDDEDTLREPSRFDPCSDTTMAEPSPKFKSVRKMFGEDEVCYIMDAKNTGNIGRYLNHSCSPNVFVQNVFVDTHDLRFPWVAFFAMNYIRAGTELTWNYNYDVGSVPGKVIFCHCGSSECRGRLL